MANLVRRELPADAGLRGVAFPTDFNVPNQPNAAILMESLRHVGYANRSAIEDIGDNCIDALAKHIAFAVKQSADSPYPAIVIADDGTGMGIDVLDEALKLGSITNHDLRSDLGKFGLGLVTAGHSLARRICVLTKQAGSPVYISISDIDQMISAGAFVKVLREANKEEAASFRAQLEDLGFADLASDELHGTIVLLDRCDGWTGLKGTSSKKLTAERVTSEADILAEDLGVTYRQFLDAGIEMFVNGKQVKAVDPLNGGELLLDDELEVEVPDVGGNILTERVRVKLGLLPEGSESGIPFRQRPNIANQGFSILRNHREIAFGKTLGVYDAKHNELNRLRGEIEFPAALDEVLGVHFSKQGVEPSQAFVHKLQALTGRTIAQVRRMSKKVVRLGDADAKMHREAEKDIAEKQHLLMLPPGATKEKRSTPQPREHQGGETRSVGTRKRTPKKTQLSDFKKARFEAADLGGEFGPIYSVSKEHGTIVITWNIAHPFYDVFVRENNPRGAKVIDYFVYSLACAELMVHDEQSLDFVENMKSITAANMRTLLR
jgi:hypothetical protein